MSTQQSAIAASKDASSIGNGVSPSGGPTPSGSQQTEWVRRTTNGVSSSNTPVNNSTSNQSGPRRPSLSTTLTHHPRDYPSSASATMISSGVATPSSTTAYQPPLPVARDASNPYKFSKEFMLQKFEALEGSGLLSDNAKLSKLLLGESDKEGLFGGTTWGSKDRNGNGTEACWDPLGQQRPVSFEAMTTEEKELFQNVNSVQKPHHTPNTPGGPNSTSGPQGQSNQPRNSTSATNLNSTYHKSNPSISSSTGVSAPPGTASPTARNRPRRDTGENSNAFPPIGRRRPDRGDESSNLFERFASRSQSYGQSGDDARENDDSGVSLGRGNFKRQPSGGAAWGVSSPVTPGGSAHNIFSNGAFGGVGSFVLNSGVPLAKPDGDRKIGGSLGKSAGRSLLGDKVEEENEDMDETSRLGPQSEDVERQAAYESSLQQLSRDSEAETHFSRDEYGRRPGSTDTDPYNPRESLRPGDLDIENPLEDKPQLGHEPSYFVDGPAVGPIGRNLMSSPTRNMGGSSGVFNALGSNVASPSSAHQGKHTPLSGFHHLQTQVGAPGMSGSQGSEPLSPSDTNPYQSPLPEAEDAAGEDDGTGPSGMRSFRPTAGSDRSQTSSAGIMGAGLSGIGGLGGFNGPLGTPGLWSNPPLSRDGGLGSGTPQTGGIGSGFFGPSADSSGIGTPSGASTGAFGTTRASRLGQLFPAEQQQQLQHLQEQQRQQNRSMLEDDGGFDPTEAFRALTMSDKAKTENRNSSDSLFGSNPRHAENPYFDADLPSSGQSQSGQQQVQSKASFPILSQQSSMSSLPQFPPGTSTSGAAPASSSQPPSQRSSGGHIMIMPDKISWVYKDPTGKIQGPFSGLEMHDWYKAGFFQPDLLIKRQEDGDFELLGQFIRRVGNSREPFLIPMQGPAFPPGAGWTAPNPWGQNTIDAANGIVQPPFPGAFPTFGTTLTAEQQNALERRKQEEQYLMARQREYLVQQQVIAKQVAAAQHMSRMSQESLHHHPSQASLHSQPSLTNIQTPGGFGAPPSQPGPFGELRHTTSNPSLEGFATGSQEFAGFPGTIQTPQGFRPSGAGPQTPQTTREQAELLERQRAQMARQYQNQQQLLERQQQQRAQLLQQAIGGQGQQQQIGNQGLVQGQQAGVQRDMPPYQVAGDDVVDISQDVGFDNDARPDMTGTALADEYELFQQQHQLQIQQHEENLRKQFESGPGLPFYPGDLDFSTAVPTTIPLSTDDEYTENIASTSITSVSAGPRPQAQLSQQQQLPQQHQHASGTYTDEASTKEPSVANESLINHDDHEDHEEHVSTSSPPIVSTTISDPPKNPWGAVSQSAMPLPFPAPKTVTSPRPSTAQSVAKSPLVGTVEIPSVPIAPWAKDPESATHQKGPSLKEIQENQAKQVAKAEAAALEARRQEQAQQAAITAAIAPVQAVSGLPSTSTWAASDVAPTNASVWAKPLAKAATGPLNKTKTLTQIQKEEEARKQKAIAQAATTTTNASAALAPATTVRRSEWASKAAAAATTPSPSSNLTGGAWTTVGAGGKKVGGPTPAVTSPPPQARPPPTTTAVAAAKVVKKPTLGAAPSVPTAQKSANDEFMKWCKVNLKGLNPGVNVDDFLNMIMSFPLEVDLISDSVYQQSTTIDGRRFAEEFIRRRKLAQQGVIVEVHGDDNKTGGGWNEVAKKGRDAPTGGNTATGDSGLGNASFKVVQGKKKRR
ncbi:hypothetical protein AA313_de0200001 [Arthrobotrys entomopaga]|nr:hypothetical protein AA313_de0200001 [Arthrobotrys entomopaga]